MNNETLLTNDQKKKQNIEKILYLIILKAIKLNNKMRKKRIASTKWISRCDTCGRHRYNRFEEKFFSELIQICQSFKINTAV